MGSFVVMADSTCDLSQDMLSKYEIDYAPMAYSIGTEEFPAMLDWSDPCSEESEDREQEGL